MKKILLFLSGILLMSMFSCNQEGIELENKEITEKEIKLEDKKEEVKFNDVVLHFNNTFKNTPIVLGTTEDVSEKGQKYTFSELKYVVSNISLINSKGEEVSYFTDNLDKGATVINQSKAESCDFTLKDIPQGNYTKIKFGLGVKTKFNTLDQEKFPLFYDKTGGKEGNKEMAMHWYWAKGYRFLKIEGVYGTENRELSIHTGSTEVGAGPNDPGAYVQGLDAYREIVLELDNFTNGAQKSVINIKADFHKLISGKAHKLTLISGEGAQSNATPNTHSSAKMKEFLDNLGFEKQGIFSVKDHADDVVNVKPVKQIRPMITRWKTANSKGKSVIALNTRGGGNYKLKKVGSDDVLKKGTLTDDKKVELDLTESGEGEYIIELTPLSDTAPMVLNMGQVNLPETLLEISQWGNFKRGESTYAMLKGCKNVVITAKDIPDFSDVIEMDNMFYGCSSITDIPYINEWNVSKVSKMSNMFNGAYKFNSYIGSWNTSNVVDMTRMFAQKSPEYAVENPEEAMGKFNQNISRWDVSKVKKMEAMFRSCVNFNQDLSKWNVSEVTTMTAMFLDAAKFNAKINDWKTANVYSMDEMFKGAKAFNQALNWDTSKVTTFNKMFFGATSFNQSLANFSWKSAYKDQRGMLDNTALSCANYDATLKSWAGNADMKTRRKFSAVGLTYSDKVSHDKLVNDKKWSISEGDIYKANCN